MKFQQVLERCKNKGLNISRNAVYYNGIQYGFIERDIDRNNIFHQEKFEEWLEMKLGKAPEGYCSFKECSEKLGIPLNTIYYLVKESGLKTIEIGKIGTKKVKYVEIEKFREFIRIRKHGSEEKYGN